MRLALQFHQNYSKVLLSLSDARRTAYLYQIKVTKIFKDAMRLSYAEGINFALPWASRGIVIIVTWLSNPKATVSFLEEVAPSSSS